MEIDLPESVLEELQKVWKREWQKLTLADDFMDMVRVFESDTLSEFYYYKEDGNWQLKLL